MANPRRTPTAAQVEYAQQQRALRRQDAMRRETARQRARAAHPAPTRQAKRAWEMARVLRNASTSMERLKGGLITTGEAVRGIERQFAGGNLQPQMVQELLTAAKRGLDLAHAYADMGQRQVAEVRSLHGQA